MPEAHLEAGWLPPDPGVVPAEWKTVRLCEVSMTVAGGRLGLTKERNYQSSGVPAFSAAGQDGYVAKAEFENTDAVVLSSVGANCGRCFLAEGSWTTLANVQAIVTTPRVSARFLHRRVNQDGYWPRSGSAQPFIKPSDIGQCWVSLPPLAEQRQIAEILDTLDEAIHNTEAIIAKLKQVKQGLLHDLLTRGIDDNGELRDPERYPEQFKDSPLGRIPREWGFFPLGEGIDFITDYRGATPPYSTEGIPVISAENVGDGEVKSTTKWVTPEVYRRTSTRGFPEPGDTIFTTEAPVGEVARVPGDQPYRLTRRVLALRPKSDWWQKDFLFWFIYYRSRSGAWDAYMHGSTVPRILKPDILARPIVRPPLGEQQRVSRVLDEHNERVASEGTGLSKLRLMKKGLMEDLLTGRVRVTSLLEEAAE